MEFDFGPDHPARVVECPVSLGDFEAFERRFRPFVERREAIYRRIPGSENWPWFEPTREKILEYYLTLESVAPPPGSVCLDAASCLSLFPNYLAETARVRAIRQDLFYPAGCREVAFPRIATKRFWNATVNVETIGSDACAIPLPDSSLDLISLHCSLEHFEGDADTRFAREAMRLLRPGGSLVVIPFYCGIEPQEIVDEDNAQGCRFQRFYCPESFARRMLRTLTPSPEIEVRVYPGIRQLDPNFYCDFSLRLRKPGPNPPPTE